MYSEIKRIFSGKRLYGSLCNYRDIAEISLKTKIDENLYSDALKTAAECEGELRGSSNLIIVDVELPRVG